MLCFNGHWHAGKVCSSQMDPGFNCTRQVADSVYGVVWVRAVCKCQRYEECPMMVHFNDLNAQRYRDKILRSIVVLFIRRHHLMFQHDNAQPLCLKDLKMSALPWPAYSPDMSPIEHVWNDLDRRVRQSVPVPANIQQLCLAIEEEWENIPQATINSLTSSMQSRCRAA